MILTGQNSSGQFAARFTSFTTQHWLSFWSVVVAAVAVVVNVGFAVWNSIKVDRKLRAMDSALAKGLGDLDDKVNSVDWNYAYILGVLDGAGITGEHREE